MNRIIERRGALHCHQGPSPDLPTVDTNDSDSIENHNSRIHFGSTLHFWLEVLSGDSFFCMTSKLRVGSEPKKTAGPTLRGAGFFF